jgi:hypothetical protein
MTNRATRHTTHHNTQLATGATGGWGPGIWDRGVGVGVGVGVENHKPRSTPRGCRMCVCPVSRAPYADYRAPHRANIGHPAGSGSANPIRKLGCMHVQRPVPIIARIRIHPPSAIRQQPAGCILLVDFQLLADTKPHSHAGRSPWARVPPFKNIYAKYQINI